MIHLHELVRSLVPHGESFNLNDRIGRCSWTTTILCVRMAVQRESVLVVHGCRRASQLDASACRHQDGLSFICSKMRQIAANPIVFGARRKLDVLAQEVFHTTVLIGCVVARRTAVAVQVGTDPTGRVDDAIKLHREL